MGGSRTHIDLRQGPCSPVNVVLDPRRRNSTHAASGSDRIERVSRGEADGGCGEGAAQRPRPPRRWSGRASGNPKGQVGLGSRNFAQLGPDPGSWTGGQHVGGGGCSRCPQHSALSTLGSAAVEGRGSRCKISAARLLRTCNGSTADGRGLGQNQAKVSADSQHHARILPRC